MLQARVLTHFTFGGKVRKPGDIIDEPEWLSSSQTVRQALKSQNHVREIDTDTDGMPSDGSGMTLGALVERLDAIDAKMDRVLAKIGSGVKKATPKKAKAKNAVTGGAE